LTVFGDPVWSFLDPSLGNGAQPAKVHATALTALRAGANLAGAKTNKGRIYGAGAEEAA
jgi:hypothetical protein